jgi:hypothetical protein
MLVGLPAFVAVDVPSSYLLLIGAFYGCGPEVNDAEDALVAAAPIVGAWRAASAGSEDLAGPRRGDRGGDRRIGVSAEGIEVRCL